MPYPTKLQHKPPWSGCLHYFANSSILPDGVFRSVPKKGAGTIIKKDEGAAPAPSWAVQAIEEVLLFKQNPHPQNEIPRYVP